MSKAADIAVIGAGLVGSAVAWGCAAQGARVVLVDGGEDDLHASAANFGLVWVQGKGLGFAEYAGLTRRSADAWAALDASLEEACGVSSVYRRSGGVKIALSEEEFDRMAGDIRRMHNQPGPAENDTRMIDRTELRDLVPAVSDAAVGASYCPHDGTADPLRTHRALSTALGRHPLVTLVRGPAMQVTPEAGGGFVVETKAVRLGAGRVVLTAGLGAPGLAKGLGLPAPVRPQRGQILVTERLPRMLDLASHTVRQTADGTVMLGDSKEDVGFDRGTTPEAATAILARAAAIFPSLRSARVVRQWAGLRVLSPDGKPVYDQSASHPDAAIITCHSGVTLAAAHAGEVAEALMAGRLSETYPAFSAARFEDAS